MSAKKRKLHPSQSSMWVDAKEAIYIFDGQKRFVAPHFYTYTSYAKGRWVGRSIIDVFEQEFIAFPSEYYVSAINSGNITVNDKRIQCSYIFKQGDQLRHRVHRHEPPVINASDSISIQPLSANGVYVVDKPASIPVHPSGKYHFNSLVHILAAEKDLFLYPVHRLDRLTSGLSLFAKDSAVASTVSKIIRERDVQKYYLARVKGKFPSINSDKCSQNEMTHADLYESELDLKDSIDEQGACSGTIWVNQPIFAVSAKKSIYGVPSNSSERARSKESCTGFRLLSFNGDTSLVLCKPVTGRTHQIRVHLDWLGFPIANDPCYGGKLCSSNSISEISLSTVSVHTLDPVCWECRSESGAAPPLPSSKKHCVEIWLHALAYFIRFSETVEKFAVSIPEWGKKDFASASYFSAI